MRSEASGSAGTLYVVATPIGNLEDITARALRILGEVDLVAAEDTRHSRKLLNHFGIRTPLISCHEHNEQQRQEELIGRLLVGASIALISDAGTPAIADPGYRLVRACHAAGVLVIPVPGPSAILAALSAAGEPTDRFIFEGFLPARAVARDKVLQELRDEPRTVVLYETPHRLLAALAAMAAVWGVQRPLRAPDHGHGSEGGKQPVRRFIKDHSARFVAQFLQDLVARRCAGWQKTLENESVGRLAGGA